MIWTKQPYIMTDDPKALDFELIAQCLSKTYWAEGRKKEFFKKSFDNSIPFCVTKEGEIIGFMRAVTDKAIFSWFADVFIIPEYRGQGLGSWMLENAMQHPDICNTKMLLGTKDAHSFYENLGFERIEKLQYSNNS